MSDTKVDTVSTSCPSFYKEKVKHNKKESKTTRFFKKILHKLKRHK